MQKLAEVSIKRPVFAAMLILALVVVGAASYFRLGVDRLPSVDVPTVTVRASLPGASPEEVEVELVKRIEDAINTVEGIDELRSISGPGQCYVTATFHLKRDIDVAAQDVRDRIANIQKDLPDDVDPPVVSKVDNDASPVLTLAVAGPRDMRDLTEIADKIIRPQLERSRGVGRIIINGGLNRAINVWVDSEKLAKYQLSITQVRDAIQRQNEDAAGGNVTGKNQEITLRTVGRFQTAAAFNNLVLTTIDGVPIRVQDIGRAEDGTKEPRSFARLDGVPTVTLEIQRQSGSNTIEVIEAAKQSIREIQDQLPPDVRIEMLRDQSKYIYAALHEINVHLVLGGLLASLVVLAFMRSWRSTIIAAVAIPSSVIATFGMMAWLDFTLNSVTMLALVLMVGVVIDDAIVVLENIFRFVEEKKMAPMEAAAAATKEIGLAVLATTLSLVVIFIPVSFMSSVSGRFLYQFGITAAVSVMVSLLVSFTLTPMMSARMLRTSDVEKGSGHCDGAGSRRGFYHLIDVTYTFLLKASMKLRWGVALLAIVVMAASVPLYRMVKQELVPTDVDEAEFELRIAGREGTSAAAMDEAIRVINEEVRQARGVRLTLATTGGGFMGAVNTGNIYVRIAPHEERTFSVTRLWKSLWKGDPKAAFRGNYSQSDVMQEVRGKLRKYRDLRVQVRNFSSFNTGTGFFDVDLAIRGPDLEVLHRVAEELREKGEAAGGFANLDTTLRLDKPEMKVIPDRDRAADLLIDARDVGTAMRIMVGGDTQVSRFHDPTLNEDYDVDLRLELSDRTRPEQIENLYLPRKGGGLVQLDNVATIDRGQVPSRIDRIDRLRTVNVRGGVLPGHAQADRMAVLQQLADEMSLPAGYTTRVVGKGREFENTFREFLWAFLLSVIFMYMILAANYESLVHPFTILLSLPLSVPFALLSLYLTGGTLNLYSALGILVLFGVVKKNSILQIDHMNHLRRDYGMPRYEAIIQANRDRLRPILMTTLALVAGMLPLAIGTGPGAEERRAVAIVVIGGQTLSLLLTLLVTPVAYSILDDIGALLTRKKRPSPSHGTPGEGRGEGRAGHPTTPSHPQPVPALVPVAPRAGTISPEAGS